MFRLKESDFQILNGPQTGGAAGPQSIDSINLRSDSFLDVSEYRQQVLLKRKLQGRETRIADTERIIIQEKGEKVFADKKATKSRLWLEQVEDELHREKLKEQIEYFHLEGYNKANSGFDTVSRPATTQIHRQSRRIIGYTLGRSTTQIKEKLIKMLTHSKQPPKPKKRSNSSENIL